MGKGAQKGRRDRTTAVLVWLLVALVLFMIAAGGLYAREMLHRSFAAVEVAQPDPEKNEHVVQVTPVPETEDWTAAPAQITPTPLAAASPTPSPVPTPVPSPTPTLHPLNGDAIGPGMEAPVVMDIQLRLMTLEYLDFEQPEEVYGEGVASAVTLFQRRNGLPETGLCDEDTFLKLKQDDAVMYAVIPGDEGEEVESIQERLIELGYLGGSADGIFDEETAEAVRRFRTLNRLGNADTVDSMVLETLFGDEPVSNMLRRGDKSDEVFAWQQRLLELGYLVRQPDGVYGKLTAAAVKRFQEDNGLVADGNLGAGTVAMLGDPDAEDHVFSVGARGEDVTALQYLLAHYGYMRSGQVTGYYGDVTEKAVRAFQERNDLRADGRMGATSLKKLLSGAVIPAPTPTPKPTPKATPKRTHRPTAKATAKATAVATEAMEATEEPDVTPEDPTPAPEGPEAGGEKTPKPTRTPKPSKTPKPTKTPKPEDAEPTEAPEPKDTGSGTTIHYGQGVDALMAAAESRLGCKYVRGAKGPNSFDCSGFVYWCLKQAGVKQSYMTSVRWRTCSKYKRITDMSELKRGDILVFSGSSASTGHVGIYMGNDRMIDAGSSSGCVVIRSSIHTSYWTSHFLMAYRIWD